MTDETIPLPEPAAWLEIDEDRLGRPIYKAVHSTPDAIVGEHRRASVFTADQVRAAVLAERERCAKACEEQEVDYEATWSPEDRVYNMAVEHCAVAIRSGHSITETTRAEE